MWLWEFIFVFENFYFFMIVKSAYWRPWRKSASVRYWSNPTYKSNHRFKLSLWVWNKWKSDWWSFSDSMKWNDFLLVIISDGVNNSQIEIKMKTWLKGKSWTIFCHLNQELRNHIDTKIWLEMERGEFPVMLWTDCVLATSCISHIGRHISLHHVYMITSL